ncbi:MAG: right-handed parallel beta-helix repeat-containing protein [Bacteroidota bacterium]
MLRSLLFLFLLSSSLAGAQGLMQFFVAQNGNDHWSGTLAAPNYAGSDGPFATLERARDAAREWRKSRDAPGVTVLIRQGTYRLNSSFILSKQDSGMMNFLNFWRAYQGETVIFTGSRMIDGFRPVTDTTVRARLAPEARDEVLVADIDTNGIGSFETLPPRGGPPMELFFEGERMTVARYPNSGWIRIADVPQSGDTLFNKGLDREKRFKGVPAGRHYGRITYAGNRPSMWTHAADIILHGYWTFDWSDSYQHVTSIDTVNQEFLIRPPHHHYGYTTNQRYYVLNVLEELDAPGEWYLDRAWGKLYFWPPAPLRKGSVEVSLMEQPLIRIDSSAWLVVEGLHLAYSRGSGIAINGGHDVDIRRCTLHSLGGDGVTIDGGVRNGVAASTIYEVGLGGIMLRGGDRKTLNPGAHFSIDNHIHHYSTWLRTGQYAVVMDGVGHRVVNNLIHDSPFEGIYIKGNDHLIERSEFYALMKETGDAGAIHTGRDWTWRGNVIRYNYFRDLKGPGLHGVMAVYLDDWASGFKVYGNVFYRAGRATMIGGGRDNLVDGNSYIECSPSIHVDARGLGWASYYFDGTYPELFTKMDDMNYSQPPYSVRYPELLRQYDGEPAVPKYNRIVNNLSFGGRWMDVYDWNAFDFSVVTVKDNIVGDPVVLRRWKPGQKGWDPYYLDIDAQDGYEALIQESAEVKRLFEGNRFVR